MKRFAFFTALLGTTALAGSALAADLSKPVYKAPQLPAYVAEWSGVYAGIEGGYGWGKQKYDSAIGGFGGQGNIANILNGGGLLFPSFDLNPANSIKQSGGLVGGFIGAQKQFGNWVFGVEADFDASWLKGSDARSSTQTGVQVSNFIWGSPTVTSVTDANQTITVPGQVLTSTGTATVQPVNITIPGQSITSTGITQPITVTIPVDAVTGTINSATTHIVFTLPGGKTCSIPIPLPIAGKVNVPGQSITVVIPPQNISVTGQTLAATVTVPGQTVPLTVTGTVLPQTVSVSGITSTGTVNAVVLQQLTDVTNVHRSVVVDSKIDELASLRGKIGFAASPNWLFYGTGGIAFAHATNHILATESFTAFGQDFSRSVNTSGGQTLFGFAAGAGIDYRFTNTNWVLGAEYLHYEFPKHTLSLGDSSGLSASFSDSRQSVDAVKGRISYIFPIQ